MRDTIIRELGAVERERNVSLVLAVESGSRCWGFASEDSDYDVRFVYHRPMEDYLRLEKVRDTIEWRLDDDLDVVGWDLSKFLRLMRGSNPIVFEWLGSPIVYYEARCFRMVREIAPRCFDPVAHAHNYLGIASKHVVRYLRSEKCTHKRYLYAIRALLACKWAIEEQRPVPMAFSELSEAMLEPEMQPLVTNLVEVKRNGLEKGTCEPIPELDAWISAQEEALMAKIGTLERPKRVEWPILDEIFRKMVL